MGRQDMRSWASRRGHDVRSSWGMGMRVMGGLAMGVGLRGAWACRGGRSPMAMAWGGGEWGPHTKESIKCIPQSGTHKIQKTHMEL